MVSESVERSLEGCKPEEVSSAVLTAREWSLVALTLEALVEKKLKPEEENLVASIPDGYKPAVLKMVVWEELILLALIVPEQYIAVLSVVAWKVSESQCKHPPGEQELSDQNLQWWSYRHRSLWLCPPRACAGTNLGRGMGEEHTALACGKLSRHARALRATELPCCRRVCANAPLAHAPR